MYICFFREKPLSSKPIEPPPKSSNASGKPSCPALMWKPIWKPSKTTPAFTRKGTTSHQKSALEKHPILQIAMVFHRPSNSSEKSKVKSEKKQYAFHALRTLTQRVRVAQVPAGNAPQVPRCARAKRVPPHCLCLLCALASLRFRLCLFHRRLSHLHRHRILVIFSRFTACFSSAFSPWGCHVASGNHPQPGRPEKTVH